MKWVTRERPKIDRMACPWRIARFVDKSPEFLYVPPGEVMRVAAETGAIPYDAPGVEFGHHGDRCNFDAFLAKYRLTDSPLQKLARIVRGADTGKPDLAPSTAGTPRPSAYSRLSPSITNAPGSTNRMPAASPPRVPCRSQPT